MVMDMTHILEYLGTLFFDVVLEGVKIVSVIAFDQWACGKFVVFSII